MAWTTPATWTAGEVPTAAKMNAQVRDNFNALDQHAHTGVDGDGAELGGYFTLDSLQRGTQVVSAGSTFAITAVDLDFAWANLLNVTHAGAGTAVGGTFYLSDVDEVTYGGWSGAGDATASWEVVDPGGGAYAQSIQRGSVSVGDGNSSGTATITSVDADVTELRFDGPRGGTQNAAVRIALTDATTVTGTRGGTTATVSARFTAIEYA